MINPIEPRPGSGGLPALYVAGASAVIVVLAIVYVLIGPAPPAPPAPQSTVFTGSFGVDTASCPNSTHVTNGSSCDIPLTLAKGAFKASLQWDTTDTMSVQLLAANGALAAPAVTGGDGRTGLTISAAALAAGTYRLRVTDVNSVGSISFSVALG